MLLTKRGSKQKETKQAVRHTMALPIYPRGEDHTKTSIRMDSKLLLLMEMTSSASPLKKSIMQKDQ
jgi:hypothetical protein